MPGDTAPNDASVVAFVGGALVQVTLLSDQFELVVVWTSPPRTDPSLWRFPTVSDSVAFVIVQPPVATVNRSRPSSAGLFPTMSRVADPKFEVGADAFGQDLA